MAYCFDEVGMRSICLTNNVNVFSTANMIFNLDWKKKKYSPLYWDKKKKFSYVFNWTEGRLYASIFDGKSIETRDVMYVHFQKRSIVNNSDLQKNLFVFDDVFSSEEVALSPSNFRKYAGKKILDVTMFRYYLDKILVKLSIKKGTSYYTYHLKK